MSNPDLPQPGIEVLLPPKEPIVQSEENEGQVSKSNIPANNVIDPSTVEETEKQKVTTPPPPHEIAQNESPLLIELHASRMPMVSSSSGSLSLETMAGSTPFSSIEGITDIDTSEVILPTRAGIPNLLGVENDSVLLKYPRPTGACFNTCEKIDPCCKPQVKPTDPGYFEPVDLEPDCKGRRKPLPTYEDNVRRKAYMKDVLLNANSHEEKSTKNKEEWEKRKHFDAHPETTESLEFLKTHNEFQVSGRQLRIPNDELQNALSGFANMHLAHEIAVNHDFQLEVYTPPIESLEEQVRTQMKKAYWDIFDEAISTHNPNPAYALSVFRELKQMLLGLLLPHNRQIKHRIESFLNESAIQYEIDHEILEFPKYTDFIINILGQLCCPARDRQIAELKQLAKPSDVFKEVMHVMEQMQLDMANFLISQIRPTIISNCVSYERKKFASYIELQYTLNQDPLHRTRPWILRHRMDDRLPIIVVGRAFAEVLNWDAGDWPETLTLDWTRFVGLAEETKRSTFLGAAVLRAFNAAKIIFGEDGEQQGNTLKCFPLREALRADLNLIIKKEDCVSEEKLKNVMDLLAEQSVKVCDQFMKRLINRHITNLEKELLRRSVRGCAREDHPVRNILLRRIQEYATNVIAAGKLTNVDFPKGIMVIEEQVMGVIVQLSRLVLHNRAVYQDLYFGIIHDEIPVPKFMDENSDEFDPSIVKAMQLLNSEPIDKLVMTKRMRN